MPQDMRDIVLILQHDSVNWAKLGKDLLWMIFHFPGGYPTLSTSYLSTGSSLYSRMQNDVWALPVQKATKLQTYSHPCETGNTWRWVAASLGCCRLQWVLEWLEPSPAEEAVLIEPWMVPRAESRAAPLGMDHCWQLLPRLLTLREEMLIVFVPGIQLKVTFVTRTASFLWLCCDQRTEAPQQTFPCVLVGIMPFYSQLGTYKWGKICH